MAAVMMTGYLLALMWFVTANVNRKEIMFPMAFVFVTALPALPLLLIGPDLGKSRLLYLPSVGFCMLLATVMDRLRGKGRWIIPGAVLAFHVAALQHNLDAWQYAAAKARSASATAARCVGPVVISGLPGTLRGVPFFANGFQEAVELQRNDRVLPDVTVMGRSASGGDGDLCVLIWDNTSDELRLVQ